MLTNLDICGVHEDDSLGIFHLRRDKSLNQGQAKMLSNPPFSYDFGTLRFYKNDVEIVLSSKENTLVLLFLQNPNQVFTKEMIYEHVWGNAVAVDDNTIMVYIKRLKNKLEDNPKKPQYIVTVRGLGYRFQIV